MKKLFTAVNQLRLILFLFIFFFSVYKLWAQSPSFSVVTDSTSKDLHQDSGKFNFNNPWLYHAGDDQQWSAVDWDDKDWQIIKYDSITSSVVLVDSTFNGIGWFRMHFETDSSMMNAPLAISVAQKGAMDIYLDGKFLRSLGKVGKDKASEIPLLNFIPGVYGFILKPVKQHVIAVRYSNFSAANATTVPDRPFATFRIFISEFNDEIVKKSDVSNYFIVGLLSAIFLVLGLVHLLLFLYYKQSKQNLYYSLYSIGLFLILFAIYNVILSTNFQWVRYSTQLVIYAFPLIPVSLAALLYSIFYNRMLKFFWILISLTCVYMILHFFWPDKKYDLIAGAVIFLMATVEMYRVIIKAIYKKKEGASIFGFGFLYIPFFIIALIIIELLTQNSKSGGFSTFFENNVLPYLTLGALLSISISMTIYLARDFARANKKLKIQISEINNLSQKAIEQETEKKRILENQNLELEKKVLERTAEVVQQKDELEITLQNLKSTQDQLFQSEKMASLGQLTAGVAHEINNPINFVSANVNPLKRNFFEMRKLLESYQDLLLQSDRKDATEKLNKDFDLRENLVESENLLKGIEEGSKRTAEIVKGLRNFSRLDEEEMKMANINDGIDSTLVLLQNKLKHQNIEVIKSTSLIPEISCYPGQLNQVFMNLISNAIDAIGELPVFPETSVRERKIYLTTLLENQSVKISVRDTGTGMSDVVKKKLFDPFFTTKDVGKGTGLGLSISYGIIEKHHGTIDVISEPGKGSEFLITLPVVQKNN